MSRNGNNGKRKRVPLIQSDVFIDEPMKCPTPEKKIYATAAEVPRWTPSGTQLYVYRCPAFTCGFHATRSRKYKRPGAR
jgi:hypothetical protein